jgi:CBS domain-containing protein
MRVLAGGIFLFLVVLVYKNGHLTSGALLEQVLWSRRIDREVIVIFFTHLLSLSLILAAFGTIGILWPLFALGGFFGFLINSFVLQSIPGFSAVAGLAGGVAFWGAVLGAPLAGALVAFELTQNLAVLLPCLIAGYGARQIRIWFKTRALIDRDLEARGVSLIEGRSASILDAVMVREAMVVDHETIHEREPVSELHGRLVKLRYPFLPVVDGQGVYMGLLTIDLVQEGWRLQDPLTSNSPLANLLEAKDLLYRSGFKVPTVKATDKLSSTTKLFEEVPCVPVLGEEGRVIGLLFAHNVRLAYDREVARRTLSLQHGAGV